MDLSVTLEDAMVSLSLTARNLGVILVNGCTPNITAVVRTSRFALYNICRIWSFLSKRHNSHLTSHAWTTATHSWLNSQPLWINSCCIAVAHLLTIYPNSPSLPPPWPPLASCCSPHPIQDDGASLQGCQKNCTCLPPNTGQTTCPIMPPLLLRCGRAGRLALPSFKSEQSPLSEVATLLCFGTSVVEQTPDQCQDSRITYHLLKKTQDSFVQTSPRPRLHDSLPWQLRMNLIIWVVLGWSSMSSVLPFWALYWNQAKSLV